MLSQAQRSAILEMNAQASEHTRDRATAAGVAAERAPGAASKSTQRAGNPAGGEGRTTANRSSIY